MTGVNQCICFATDNLYERFGGATEEAIRSDLGVHDDSNVGVREPIVEKVMVGLVVEQERRLLVFFHKVSEQIINVFVSLDERSIGISSHTDKRVRIFIS